MAHAQKPDFVFRRNGRVHLNRRRRQFSLLLAAELCASAVVMLDTPCSEVVWRVLATHSILQFPLHFPSHASPCAITFQLESTRWKRGWGEPTDISLNPDMKTFSLSGMASYSFSKSRCIILKFYFKIIIFYVFFQVTNKTRTEVVLNNHCLCRLIAFNPTHRVTSYKNHCYKTRLLLWLGIIRNGIEPLVFFSSSSFPKNLEIQLQSA